MAGFNTLFGSCTVKTISPKCKLAAFLKRKTHGFQITNPCENKPTPKTCFEKKKKKKIERKPELIIGHVGIYGI